MKRNIVLLAFIGLFCFSISANGQDVKGGVEKQQTVTDPSALSSASAESQKAAPKGSYVPVVVYDPARDADKDIQDALAEAKRTKKRVLLEVGGLWCSWCRHLDAFFDKQAGVLALRDKYFVTLKINFSDENKNEDVLSRYPKIAGFPHLFVLDADGTFLHSQDTEVLEEGKGYSRDKFVTFLELWGAKPVAVVRS